MNKSDSERLAALLDKIGLEETARPEEADFILLNSCSVRQTAEDRIFGQVRNFAKLRKNNPRLVLGVTGCMAGRDVKGDLRRKLPEVDLFFPTRDMVHLPRWLAEHGLVEMGEFATAGNSDSDIDYLRITPRYNNPHQAFLSIQTGCNNFCTYCVVPYARGMERNRPAVDILAEARALAEQGTIEITLLGQTVNSYLAPDSRVAFSIANPYENHFAALLWEINHLPGIQRIHYTAPHPNSMTDEVIDALALPKQVNYLHLPVQTGSDEMLQRMNRKYTRADFLDVIQRIKARVPGIALGTDIIVGFSGETEEMFQATISLYQEVEFDISYTAMYSPRTGTPAWRAFKDDVPRAEKRHRWRRLHELMETIVWRKNQKFVGRVVEVLVESCENGVCFGNSREMKLTRFPGDSELIGQIVPVRISSAYEWTLDGVLEYELDLAQICAKENQKQLS
ncbi:tRNA (N6-isopentenyl adenosine(37)-C2)-methylthiotransferase MiaB [Patescibacteria group bacterium]|nr:tRNA (N6-isopentenyl adenosine(37)-C2)-methylthiotransferase MiaB [Patescibacteria group bacterium]MBU1029104.1 tRNA (N6-isopentenyl adenosine(37)-C2)-methylthiotransferase MiaB [Patescibacteria group bacterium]MBU1916226.1 tRNA (N6-isopentenyl adenosine(37)-C2)-methylthiotransferase MiaB [Patescibacteria group bacterium]